MFYVKNNYDVRLDRVMGTQPVDKMSYSDWLAVAEPDFFFQAPASGTQKWLAMQTIEPLSPYINRVTLLRVDHEKLYKLDGRARKALWEQGELTKPVYVTIDVLDLSQQAFDQLCRQLYAQQLEHLPAHEVVIVSYQELGLSLQSERLRHGFITEAINIALRGKPRAQQDKRSVREKQNINMTKALENFREELLALDQFNPKPDIFLTGVLAAALVMLALDNKSLAFYQRLNDLDGHISPEGQLDPVEALLNVIDSYKNKRTSQVRMQLELFGKTVKAVTLWQQGEDSAKYWTRNTLRLADTLPILREMKRIKNIHEVRDL